MPVRFTQGKGQGLPVGVNDQVAFEPLQTVLSGVADLRVGPLFDLMTLAS